MRLNTMLETKQRPLVSFEFFPPRDEQAAAKLDGVIERLAALEPDCVSVTFGAGGSTREGSYQLLDKLMHEKGLDVIAYFAGFGLGPDEISSVLERYARLGVETLFVVRGDAPRDQEDFVPNAELLDFIRERFDFCLGAAGYPEGHPEASSQEQDLAYCRLKQEKGARFIIAQYCYDNDYFFDFVARARAIGISVPIIPGIMPIYSVKLTHNLARVCGASIPQKLSDDLAQCEDAAAVVQYGIDFATDQCRELLARGAGGLHFYTMDRSNTLVEVLGRLRSEGLL